MKTLPVKYRIPATMIRYTIFAAVVLSLVAAAGCFGLSASGTTTTLVMLASLAVIAITIVRVLRLGTVVSADGITRLGFLRDRRHPWPDIHELDVIDREVVHVAYGFQVSSRFVVTVAVGPRRRRKTLLFLDERGFSGFDRFRDEVNAVAALWDQRRGA